MSSTGIGVTYEGVDNSTPVDQTTPTYTTGTAGATCPSITTQTDGAMVGSLCLNDGNPGGDFGDGDIPAGTTLRGTIQDATIGNGVSQGFADEIHATAEVTGTKDYQQTGTEEYVAMTFALRPAATGIVIEVPTGPWR
jgi:hypothetical protein